jgi:hypothetical protein
MIKSIPLLARKVIFRFRATVAARPHVYACVKRAVAFIPFLDRRLRIAVSRELVTKAQSPIPQAGAKLSLTDLTPRAREVYVDLIKALEHLT